MYRLLQDIADQESDSEVIREQVNDLKHANVKRLENSLEDLQANLEERVGPYESADRVRPLRDAIEARKDQFAVDPMALLYEDAPDTQALVQALGELDIKLDRQGLRHVGAMKMLVEFVGEALVAARAEQVFDAQQQAIFKLLTDEAHREAWPTLLAFWRAKVLTEDYRMDPGFMYLLMERFGPLDWRHPAAQSIYWSALGVETSLQVLDRAKIDVLNTERQVIHGMQAMMYSGRLNLDPTSGRLVTLPDPRFIPAYEKAMFDAVERYEGGDLGSSGTISSFESGHENFLVKAVVYSWLYGDAAQARDYYDKLRTMYGDKAHNLRDRKYSYALDDFVMRNLRDELMGEGVNMFQFIDAMLRQAFLTGLGNNRRDIFNQYLMVAQNAQRMYRQERGHVNPNAADGRERLLWGNFDEIVNAVFVSLMRSPQVSLIERSRIYRNTPNQIKLATYTQFRQAVAQQMQGSGLSPQTLFPPPRGFEESLDIQRKLEGAADRQGTTGVERR